MKYIVAIFPPDRLKEVLDELDRREMRMITVGQVMGYGSEKGEAEVYRGHTEIGRLLHKVKLEVAVQDHDVDAITTAISNRLSSDVEQHPGEIFVMELVDRTPLQSAAEA